MSPLNFVVVVLAITTIKADLDEIPIERAEQSSDYFSAYSADKALDGDFSSPAVTAKEDNPWLRLYFTSSSNVEKVVIEEGRAYDVPSCTYSVSVYKGEVKTLCGTYTRTGAGGKVKHYFNEAVQCGGKEGDSVVLEVTGCTTRLSIYEIKVYSQAQGDVKLFDAKLFNAKQSSDYCRQYYGWVCASAEKAIDDSSDNSVTAEGTGTHWWEASMYETTVHQVDLKAFTAANRWRGYSYGFDGVEIKVDLYNGDSIVGHCESFTPTETNSIPQKTVECDRVRADRVRISAIGTKTTFLAVNAIRVIGDDAVCQDGASVQDGGVALDCARLISYCNNDHIKEICQKTCGTCSADL